MNTDVLLKQFHRISDAPDAIQRLRRFVLDLAVRGKLVEQDPIDEPGTVLLKSVQEQKCRLIRLGVLRQEKPLPTVATEDIPFPIPTNWGWARIGETSTLITKGSTPTSYGHSYQSSGVNFIKVEAIRNGQLLPQNVTSFISDETHAFMARSRLAAGDILFSIAGSIGTCACVSERVLPANTNQALAIIRGTEIVFDPTFVLFCIKSSVSTLILSKARGGAMNNISLEDVRNFLVPVPPLKEQHRIVAKVDELMDLCDRLEVAKAERDRRRDQLIATCHYQLSNSADTIALRKNAHFVIGHLPCLTMHPDQIKKVRESVINIAVRGQLVPQNPTEEPASELIRRIEAQKDQMIAGGKIKREKTVARVTKEDEPFEVPIGWTWVRLDALTQLITKGSSPKWQGVQYVSEGDGILFVTSENVGNYRLRKTDQPKYVEKRFNDIEPRSILKRGDILLTLVGASIGRTAVYDLNDGANINQAVALIRLVQEGSELFIRYLLHYFNSPFAVNLMLASRVTTAQPNISLTDTRHFPVPIPPLAEQQRIVARVDELMALCDRLETQLATAQAETSCLLESVLHHALNDSYYAKNEMDKQSVVSVG
jgi:type I restriction enzyme, S subunit